MPAEQSQNQNEKKRGRGEREGPVLDVLGEFAPLGVPVHARRYQAAARAEEKGEDENDIGEHADGVVP